MNITEFAIGNYVLLNGQPERIRGIQEDQFEKGRHVLLLGEKGPLWYTLNEIEPIAITPFVLCSCGFLFDNDTRYGHSYNGYGYSIDLNHDYAIRSIGGNSYFINSLHELLNVFNGFPEKNLIQIDYDKLKAAI